ncbi:hypothetical protein JCM5350_001268 [Sporobolomyces pararoseus]
MSDNKDIDYLSRLPPELIQNIFDLACYSRSSLAVPPSRYLKSFVERSLYSQTFVDSYRSLGLFCHRVTQARLDQIRSLNLNLREYPYMYLDADEEDPHLPADEDFVSLLQRLTALEDLQIQGSARLALLVLSPPVAISSLPNLRSLDLDSPFDPLDDPFHPLHYTVLAHYPSLEKLDLSISRESTSISSFPSNPIPSSFLPFASIKSFTLYGLELTSPHIPALLASLVNVTEVSIIDENEHSKVGGLANYLPSPGSLLQLEIVSFSDPDPDSPSPSPTLSLKRFSNLRSLSISYAVDLRSISFHQDLGSLVHLRSLTLGFDTELSVFNLSRSLDVLNLESLVLEGLKTHIKKTDPETIERPAWTNVFSREGFRKLVEKCQQKGIKLSGGSFGAFELEEQFDRRELENGTRQRFEQV